MFSRLFPMDPRRIISESYEGALSALYALPVTFGINIAVKMVSDAFITPALPADAASAAISRLEAQKTMLQDSPLNNFNIVVLAPLLEEFIFRGVMTPAIRSALAYEGINAEYAPWLTTILFASLHNINTLGVFYLGNCFENLTSAHDGSLWSSISAHMLNNYISTYFYVPEKFDEQIAYIKTHNKALRLERIQKTLAEWNALITDFNASYNQPEVTVMNP